MESFTNVGTGNLEQIIFVKLLKHAPLQLYKLKDSKIEKFAISNVLSIIVLIIDSVVLIWYLV